MTGEQRMLDAATGLSVARRHLLRDVDRRGVPTRPGTTLVGVGMANIRRELIRIAPTFSELHSAHPTCTMTEESFEQDRSFLSDGKSMTSMYNPAGTPEHHRRYLTDDVISPGTYFAPAPVQMIIFGRTTLVIEGLTIGGERSVLAVSDPAVLAAAWRYWHSLRPLAVSVGDTFGQHPLARFSPRQREIVHLLADEHTDKAIAARLDLSLRTVQYEVAAIMRLLDVRSRFGAGMAIGRMGLPR